MTRLEIYITSNNLSVKQTHLLTIQPSEYIYIQQFTSCAFFVCVGIFENISLCPFNFKDPHKMYFPEIICFCTRLSKAAAW